MGLVVHQVIERTDKDHYGEKRVRHTPDTDVADKGLFNWHKPSLGSHERVSFLSTKSHILTAESIRV
jgi:hypothetical protein